MVFFLLPVGPMTPRGSDERSGAQHSEAQSSGAATGRKFNMNEQLAEWESLRLTQITHSDSKTTTGRKANNAHCHVCCRK